jgi:hypothetical protein
MKIFLSLPIANCADANSELSPSYRKNIEALIIGLRNAGHAVFCILEELNWKVNSQKSPEELFGAGLLGIDEAEKMIVLLDTPISSGVQIELGYAYARGKSIEIYQVGEPGWSNMAFGKLCKANIYSVDDTADFVRKAIQNNS